MKTLNVLACLAAAFVLALSVPLVAAVQLLPVASGLASPLFLGHAGDLTGRLFIVERGGLIKVLQPGSSSPTVFLNISARVVAGGEQGLLGLAFHPQYEINGQFFVYYTNLSSNLVVARYGVSSDPNVASDAETILLTIPHPVNTNHNGGMLAFGPDNMLYIGVGDGGAGNDPPNNAQNLGVLLGKVLRIDVNVAEGSDPAYAVPPDNPFFGSVAGRDEIFAFGLRNPWRFSFDKASSVMWLADVGQGAREEVNTPIVSGGNYGWRVYEGTQCTGNDPTLCNPSAYISPLFEYEHTGSRCSITGGYVYRGLDGAVPAGTYVYGDYCTGEIFGWNGAQNLLLDTSLNISSFGEDEDGELYVVGLGGTVHKLITTTPPPTCTYSISPARANYSSAGGSGSVAVTAPAGCLWTAASTQSWLTVTGGATGNGNGAVTYSVAPYSGRQGTRNGRITIAGQTFTVKQSR